MQYGRSHWESRGSSVGTSGGLSLEQKDVQYGCLGGEPTVALLQWARANRCPWDAEALLQAAEAENYDVVAWAKTNGCPVV